MRGYILMKKFEFFGPLKKFLRTEEMTGTQDNSVFWDRIGKAKGNIDNYKELSFIALHFLQIANFDTDKEGLAHYDEEREEEEEAIFDNYGLSDNEVIDTINRLIANLKDKCPTKEEMQLALQQRAEELFLQDQI